MVCFINSTTFIATLKILLFRLYKGRHFTVSSYCLYCLSKPGSWKELDYLDMLEVLLRLILIEHSSTWFIILEMNACNKEN